VDRLGILKDEIERLDDFEKVIDQHKSWVQQSIKNITEDSSNDKQAYVTHEDICTSFEGDTLLAIQAPNGTQVKGLITRERSSKGLLFTLLLFFFFFFFLFLLLLLLLIG
jgi:hypothetical protein